MFRMMCHLMLVKISHSYVLNEVLWLFLISTTVLCYGLNYEYW